MTKYKDLYVTLESARTTGLQALKAKVRKERSSASSESRRILSEIRRRTEFVDQLEKSVASQGLPSKSVFISYSVASNIYLSPLTKLLEDRGFQVNRGFDRVVQKDKLIHEGILSHIRTSTFFIGLWAPEFRGENIVRSGEKSVEDVSSGTFPSVWLPFELGLAIDTRKTFKLLIHRSIHRYYRERPYSDIPHIMFDEIDYLIQIELCVEWLEERYQALIEPELETDRDAS